MLVAHMHKSALVNLYLALRPVYPERIRVEGQVAAVLNPDVPCKGVRNVFPHVQGLGPALHEVREPRREPCLIFVVIG